MKPVIIPGHEILTIGLDLYHRVNVMDDIDTYGAHLSVQAAVNVARVAVAEFGTQVTAEWIVDRINGPAEHRKRSLADAFQRELKGCQMSEAA